MHLMACGVQLRTQLLRRLNRNIQKPDPRALCGKTPDNGLTYTAAATGDNHRLILQIGIYYAI